MLHDLDETIKQLIIERGKLNKNEIDVSFEQPNSEWASRLSRPTINCWCYDVRENVKLRNLDMQQQRNGRHAQVRLPPMRLDLTYLVTAWARKIEDEHQLLWRALGAMAKSTLLSPDDCVGAMRDQPYDIPVTIAQTGESTISFTDLWSVLDNQMRLGFTLQMTVALDTERGFEAPLVFERRLGVGQGDPETEHMIALDRTFIYSSEDAEKEQEHDENDETP